jgi:molybdopterin synthase sulfur carrier subunit
MSHRVKLVYFAWVRERAGRADETLDLPPEVTTAGELIAWLATRDEGYAYAFERPALIRVAIDHEHVDHAAPLAGAREVAFFPPMTGG